MFRVLALCGPVGSGKSIALNYLKMNGYSIINFAEPAIIGTKSLFLLSDDQMRENTNITLCNGVIINPSDALNFIQRDVFQHNIHHLTPGMGNVFWPTLSISRILRYPGKYVISNIPSSVEYYELKKYIPDSLVIKITNRALPSTDYVPFDLEIFNNDSMVHHLSVIKD